MPATAARMGARIRNKIVRQKQYASERHDKAQRKLNRRLALKEQEDADPSLKTARLAQNVPRTVENTREWIGHGGWSSKAAEGQSEDRRTQPVQLVEDEEGGQRLDLAGLEALFPDEEPLRMMNDKTTAQPQASTSAIPMDGSELAGAGRVLLTTSPKPSEEVVELLADLQNMLGGVSRAHIVPRKTTRFVLSKVTRWATKRGYSAIVIVGEDNSAPASVTISKLPAGPTAHFRLTSVELNKDIQGHGAPTGHSPELVLSNMSTPLGLSIGRLLGTLFPPMPQFEGRQVVAVHNQRDFIFVRRFRYMFALRSTEEETQIRAKERGMDTDVRTRMQELGPRLTLKLRWLKRGTLAEGRRKAGGAVAGEQKAPEGVEPEITSGGEEEAHIDQSLLEDFTRDQSSATSAEVSRTKVRPTRRKSTHPRKSGELMIPRLQPTPQNVPTVGNLAMRRRKPKRGASVLDSMNLQGGMLDSRKEWQWDPRMQVSKRKFFM